MLSPLLANLLLDDLDKELQRRGHRFCRYADDCNIYVRSKVAGERVLASITAFLEGKLHLKVNCRKSAVAYIRHAQCRSHLQRLDEWIRRKLRCVRLKQRKRAKSIADFLHSLGVPMRRAWTTAACGKGWWRMALSPAAHEAMTPAWFTKQGLVSLTDRYLELNH
ncbi:MAG: reverse transcriptase domain-containing protein [Pirellulaceae bacterium]